MLSAHRNDDLLTGKTIAVICAVALFTTACGKKSDAGAPDDTYASLVNKDGTISFPADFPESYMFIGTWSVTAPSGEAEIHSVYSRPADVDAFRSAGKFPDGAVLIKEVTIAKSADLVTGRASWAGDRKIWFLMVKDRNGRFAGNPLWGDGWGWAQFDPTDTKKQTATNYQTDCKSCHIPAKSSEWVYTYAYPALGEKGQVGLPVNSHRGNPPGIVPAVATQAMTSGVASGKMAFDKTCRACHSINPGGAGIGPTLAGVVGRKAGTVPNFDYSDQIRNSGITWTADNIDKHIEAPKSFIPGNRMGNLFPNGIKDPGQRRDIIVYLKSVAQ